MARVLLDWVQDLTLMLVDWGWGLVAGTLLAATFRRPDCTGPHLFDEPPRRWHPAKVMCHATDDDDEEDDPQ